MASNLWDGAQKVWMPQKILVTAAFAAFTRSKAGETHVSVSGSSWRLKIHILIHFHPIFLLDG
jgi:hypothetical protein